jgi:hypothetical protein
MMELPDFSSPLWFAVATIVIFLVVIGRYFLIAGLFHGIFYLWYPDRFQQRKINNRDYKKGQFRKEVKWSMVTAFLFAITEPSWFCSGKRVGQKSTWKQMNTRLVAACQPNCSYAAARNLLLLVAQMDA